MLPIENSIQQQIETNQSKNLLYDHAEQIMEIEPGFRSTLEALLAIPADKAEPLPAGMVSFAVRSFLKKLYSVNQYLRINPKKMEELEHIYWLTWQTMLRTGNIQAALREQHYPKLSQWLATLYPNKFLEPIRVLPAVGHVVCEEYSALLQLELFQIDVTQLKQPLIDIGCGSRANLVRYLRSLEIEAYGFDRFLEIQAPYLEQKDWFDMVFEPGQWGSILSNMAFTNHLNHTYHHDRNQFAQYLLKMKDIFASLAIGGSFYYAPGLPFIEDRLDPTQYKVERKRVIQDVFVSVVTRTAE
jgi:hypothetical protein